ncbi:hypothetical protein BGW36DRAFT_19569 [Talaromyces proteolyticus]|uniref:Tachykinin family protein n=1 Tax=Talaromyces proteolyticus TaxID=1131652 RepID=A0AAD4L7B5_9EURO|nr:uncharacterized protein BGW36DRAFT_19569 [Talaromyces proteolyticus]KAH8705920.1 hypothetical protein BGW36DRAFT_19569 [Talaromyces proteolyticus]
MIRPDEGKRFKLITWRIPLDKNELQKKKSQIDDLYLFDPHSHRKFKKLLKEKTKKQNQDSQTKSQMTGKYQSLHTNSSHARHLLNKPDPTSKLMTILDPFCSLPYDLTQEESKLLQFYLTTVPSMVYGVRPDGAFNPVRDVSFALSCKSSTTLQWIIIGAEAFFTTGQILPRSLSRRMSVAYKTLNQALPKNDLNEKNINKNGNSAISDDLIAGIIMATITESRISPPNSSKVHLRGYEAAIKSRKGLREIITNSENPVLHSCHLMPYLVCKPSVEDITLTGSGGANFALGKLQEIIKRKNNIDESELGPISPSSKLNSEKLSLPLPSFDLAIEESTRYLLSSTALSPYLTSRGWKYSKYSLMSSHFLALFLVVYVLWETRLSSLSHIDAAGLGELFVNKLNHHLDPNIAHGRHRQDTILLNTEGLMWMVVKTVFDFYSALESKQDAMRKQGDILIEAVLALKLLGTSDEIVSQSMIEYLCGILCGRSPNMELSIRKNPPLGHGDNVEAQTG